MYRGRGKWGGKNVGEYDCEEEEEEGVTMAAKRSHHLLHELHHHCEHSLLMLPFLFSPLLFQLSLHKPSLCIRHLTDFHEPGQYIYQLSRGILFPSALGTCMYMSIINRV